jgi:hypothetical protein
MQPSLGLDIYLGLDSARLAFWEYRHLYAAAFPQAPTAALDAVDALLARIEALRGPALWVERRAGGVLLSHWRGDPFVRGVQRGVMDASGADALFPRRALGAPRGRRLPPRMEVLARVVDEYIQMCGGAPPHPRFLSFSYEWTDMAAVPSR